jgi:exosortase/archaeosortase family protein
MSLVVPASGREPSAVDPTREWTSFPIGVAVIGVGLALLVWQARFRLLETNVSAWAVRALHLRPAASAVGTNVIFPLHGRWVGYSLTVACTAALLMLPFFLIAGLLLLTGRIDRRRGLSALLAVSVIIFVVNQLRMLLIAASMMWWGFQRGYERSHVFLGTVLSTIGVITGMIIFVWMLLGDSSRRRRGLVL